MKPLVTSANLANPGSGHAEDGQFKPSVITDVIAFFGDSSVQTYVEQPSFKKG